MDRLSALAARLLPHIQKKLSQWTYLTTPLTSTAWDGDPYSTNATSIEIDLSTVFGVPEGVKAVLMRVVARDSATWGTNTLRVQFGPTDASYYELPVYPAGGDVYAVNTGVLPCSNGNIWYRITASGSGTMDVWIEIWGYYL